MPILESTKHSAIPRNVLVSVWGIMIGLFFGVPPAWAAHDIGMKWPYGAAVVTLCLVVGLLIAFTVDAFLPHRDPSIDRPVPLPRASGALHERLAEEKACLDRLDKQRRGGASPGKAEAERIIWGELLELELQDIDEQVSRSRSQASDPDPGKS